MWSWGLNYDLRRPWPLSGTLEEGRNKVKVIPSPPVSSAVLTSVSSRDQLHLQAGTEMCKEWVWEGGSGRQMEKIHHTLWASDLRVRGKAEAWARLPQVRPWIPILRHPPPCAMLATGLGGKTLGMDWPWQRIQEKSQDAASKSVPILFLRWPKTALD